MSLLTPEQRRTLQGLIATLERERIATIFLTEARDWLDKDESLRFYAEIRSQANDGAVKDSE